MLDERDHAFVTEVLNASLSLMSILVAVIALLAVAYKDVQTSPMIAEPISKAIMGTSLASVFAGFLALAALCCLRLGRGSASVLAWAFAAMIVIMMGGIIYVVNALMA
ncbi:MAG: hypothetical protein ACRECP_07800 [Methylocella sp.]